MAKPSDKFFNPEDLIDGLRQAMQPDLPDPKHLLSVGVPVKSRVESGPIVPVIRDRRELRLVSDKQSWTWYVESLSSLFRGDRVPPELGDEPQDYMAEFILIELHVVEICRFAGIQRDAQMEEIFSALRRRPDGRSLGLHHDYLWQASALLLGSHRLSQAEFQAIIGRLEKSCRTFGMGPTSKNYLTTLMSTIG